MKTGQMYTDRGGPLSDCVLPTSIHNADIQHVK